MNVKKLSLSGIKAALIDMDGVLYDSMKYHTLAWHRLMTETGINCTRNEFYLYEGMTGAATIKMLFEREFHRVPPMEEITHLYARKTEYFKEFGKREKMPGAERMLKSLEKVGISRVLVTGSGQASIIDSLDKDYPGAFRLDMRVTAADVEKGKPDPEPYLRGLQKAGVDSSEAIVIENAPLGVRAGKGAGIFTIAVTTGPIPETEFVKEGADLIYPSMTAFADAIELSLL